MGGPRPGSKSSVAAVSGATTAPAGKGDAAVAPVPTMIQAGEYERFRQRIRALTRIDLDQYKGQQLMRRLATLARLHGVSGLDAYGDALARDAEQLRRFRDWFTINVTWFRRDPQRWEALRDRILPGVLAERPHLRVWSAGCSNGAEIYTMALLLARFPQSGPHTLLGTDIDPAALEQARAGGPYSADLLAELSQQERRRYFVPDRADPRTWWVGTDLRRAVTFRHLDLLQDEVGVQFDVILCRNVIIYFTDEAKALLLRRLAHALRPGGILFVGGAEFVPHPAGVGLAPLGPALYQRVSVHVP